ncbi:MAG: iron chaperone [Chitinophagaceae bacterium]
MKKYTSVEEYLMDVPDDKRIALEKLRKTIESIVPNSEEFISYGMPTFKYNGPLVSYAAFKEHCSLFPWNSTLINKFSEELKPFKTSKGTIQFTVDKPLPSALVKKIVKARMKENEKECWLIIKN